jgi:hypothetical protein
VLEDAAGRCRPCCCFSIAVVAVPSVLRSWQHEADEECHRPCDISTPHNDKSPMYRSSFPS